MAEQPDMAEVLRASGLLLRENLQGDGFDTHVLEGTGPGELFVPQAPCHGLLLCLGPTHRIRQVRDGKAFDAEFCSGDLILAPQGSSTRWQWCSPDQTLQIEIEPDFLATDRRLEVINRFQFRDAEVENLCRLILNELRETPAPDKLYVESLVTQLAVQLSRRHSPAAAGSPAKGGLTRRQLRLVLDYVEANLGADLALADLAAMADLSRHHFARMFKQSTGVAPHRFVLDRRIQRAKDMLRNGASSGLAELSASLGFCSQSHFTNTFRRMVGASPGQYRAARTAA